MSEAQRPTALELGKAAKAILDGIMGQMPGLSAVLVFHDPVSRAVSFAFGGSPGDPLRILAAALVGGAGPDTARTLVEEFAKLLETRTYVAVPAKPEA